MLLWVLLCLGQDKVAAGEERQGGRQDLARPVLGASSVGVWEGRGVRGVMQWWCQRCMRVRVLEAGSRPLRAVGIFPRGGGWSKTAARFHDAFTRCLVRELKRKECQICVSSDFSVPCSLKVSFRLPDPDPEQQASPIYPAAYVPALVRIISRPPQS